MYLLVTVPYVSVIIDANAQCNAIADILQCTGEVVSVKPTRPQTCHLNTYNPPPTTMHKAAANTQKGNIFLLRTSLLFSGPVSTFVGLGLGL